jgi:hypothetical protein
VVVTPEGPRELVLDEPLAPGTRVEVTVRYDSRGREGTESKPVMVYHDGPAGRAALEVGVQVEPFLISETNPLTFGRLYLDGAEEQRTTLSSSTGEPFGLSVQLRGHAQPGLELSLEPSAPGPDGRAASWQLIARLDPVGLAGPGGLLENPDPSALGGQNLIAAVVLETDVPLPDPGPVDPGTPAHHFLDLAVTATLLAPVQASTGYLSFGFLAPGAATSSSVRIECFAPELAEAFRAAEPTVEVLDGEGAVPDWAGNFTPTLRLVEPEAAGNRPLTPGALCAWDLEVLGRGFRGGDRNRVTGRVVLDFGGELLPDQSMAFQAMLQP